LSAVPLVVPEQVPSEPLTLQAWQVPEQVELQQTPCEQYCLPSGAGLQSLAALHEAPGGFRPHDPFTHELGETHWFVWVHTPKHRLPLHMKG
jgi:hypothetical protein